MDWIEAILKEHTDENGVLDVAAANKAIDKAFPDNAVPKKKYNDKVDELTGKANELKAATDTIKTLEKGNKDNEALQTEISTYKEKAEKLEKANADLIKTGSIKDALRGAKCKDVDYAIYKQGGVDGFTFDKSGAVVGIKDVVSGLKTDHAWLFEEDKQEKPDGKTDGGKAGYTPKDGKPEAKGWGAVMAEKRIEREKQQGAPEAQAPGLWD